MAKYVFLITYKAKFEDGKEVEGQVSYRSDNENLAYSEFQEWKQQTKEHLEERYGVSLVSCPIIRNCIRLDDDRPEVE